MRPNLNGIDKRYQYIIIEDSLDSLRDYIKEVSSVEEVRQVRTDIKEREAQLAELRQELLSEVKYDFNGKRITGFHFREYTVKIKYSEFWRSYIFGAEKDLEESLIRFTTRTFLGRQAIRLALAA
jgi:hypothetical protein